MRPHDFPDRAGFLCHSGQMGQGSETKGSIAILIYLGLARTYSVVQIGGARDAVIAGDFPSAAAARRWVEQNCPDTRVLKAASRHKAARLAKLSSGRCCRSKRSVKMGRSECIDELAGRPSPTRPHARRRRPKRSQAVRTRIALRGASQRLIGRADDSLVIREHIQIDETPPIDVAIGRGNRPEPQSPRLCVVALKGSGGSWRRRRRRRQQYRCLHRRCLR